jgi:hypothetical protein
MSQINVIFVGFVSASASMAYDNAFFSKCIEKTGAFAEHGEMFQTNTCKHIIMSPIVKAVGGFLSFKRSLNMLYFMMLHLNRLIGAHQNLSSNTFAARIPAKPQGRQ